MEEQVRIMTENGEEKKCVACMSMCGRMVNRSERRSLKRVEMCLYVKAK
jgi:hypothetical protein